MGKIEEFIKKHITIVVPRHYPIEYVEIKDNNLYIENLSNEPIDNNDFDEYYCNECSDYMFTPNKVLLHVQRFHEDEI